jgi:hypothetical protein
MTTVSIQQCRASYWRQLRLIQHIQRFINRPTERFRSVRAASQVGCYNDLGSHACGTYYWDHGSGSELKLNRAIVGSYGGNTIQVDEGGRCIADNAHCVAGRIGPFGLAHSFLPFYLTGFRDCQ